MKQCPFCNTLLSDNSQFCTSCGNAFPQEGRCPQCGGVIKKGHLFCQSCGTRTTSVVNQEFRPVPQPEREISKESFEYEEDNSSSKVLYSVLLIVGFVILLIGGRWLYSNMSSQRFIVDEQTASIEDYSDGSYNDNFTDDSASDNFASQDYGWLEGHWVCDSPTGRIHLLIQNGHICQYRNSPSESDNLPYDIRDGRINAHYDDGLDITYDIDEENKRIGMGSGYYAQKIGSTSTTASSAYDTDSSTRFQSADDVYGYLANQRFRERSQGIELRYDGSCQLYINGEWNAPPFHVVSLQSKQAIINYNSPSDGSMRLIVRIVGRDIEVQDPIDGTVFYQVKSRY